MRKKGTSTPIAQTAHERHDLPRKRLFPGAKRIGLKKARALVRIIRDRGRKKRGRNAACKKKSAGQKKGKQGPWEKGRRGSKLKKKRKDEGLLTLERDAVNRTQEGRGRVTNDFPYK